MAQKGTEEIIKTYESKQIILKSYKIGTLFKMRKEFILVRRVGRDSAKRDKQKAALCEEKEARATGRMRGCLLHKDVHKL